MGKLDEAVAVLREAVRLVPGFAKARKGLLIRILESCKNGISVCIPPQGALTLQVILYFASFIFFFQGWDYAAKQPV
jgi:hypothetical protein